MSDLEGEVNALKHVVYQHLGKVEDLNALVTRHDRAYQGIKWRYLAAIFLLGGLLGYCARPVQGLEGGSAIVRDDQVRPTCSKRGMKRWQRDYAALTPDQQRWMGLAAHRTREHDFTGDGVPDQLEILATQYVRECDIGKIWPHKEVQVTLRDGSTGRRTVWNWRGGLPLHYAANLGAKTISLTGEDAYGAPWEKVLTYGR